MGWSRPGKTRKQVEADAAALERHYHETQRTPPTRTYGDGGRTTVGDMIRWLSNFEDDATVVMYNGVGGQYVAPRLGLTNVRPCTADGHYLADESGDPVVAIRGH